MYEISVTVGVMAKYGKVHAGIPWEGSNQGDIHKRIHLFTDVSLTAAFLWSVVKNVEGHVLIRPFH